VRHPDRDRTRHLVDRVVVRDAGAEAVPADLLHEPYVGGEVLGAVGDGDVGEEGLGATGEVPMDPPPLIAESMSRPPLLAAEHGEAGSAQLSDDPLLTAHAWLLRRDGGTARSTPIEVVGT
jgi:hypothetical protein